MTRRWPRATLTGTLPTELVAALALRRQSGTRRVLIYSHDTYGLGHLRRSLLIARALSARSPAPSVLLVTGSSRAHAFPRPPGCDIFQLPGIFKRADGTYQARSPDASLAAVLELRSALLHSLARSFAPDMVVVDNVPVGLCGELGAMLKDLRRRRDAPELVLGLRDVLDHPERVQAEWNAAGAWDYLESVYDRILVYGDPRVLTTAQEPDLHTRYAQKLHFTGYVAPPLPDSREDVSGLPSIVVTPGGGGDGQRLLRAYATALERERSPLPVRSVIILGPFLSGIAADRDHQAARASPPRCHSRQVHRPDGAADRKRKRRDLDGRLQHHRRDARGRSACVGRTTRAPSPGTAHPSRTATRTRRHRGRGDSSRATGSHQRLPARGHTGCHAQAARVRSEAERHGNHRRAPRLRRANVPG